MTDFELAVLLNVSVPEADEFIQQCDRFDRYMDSLYDLEAVEQPETDLDNFLDLAEYDYNVFNAELDD